MNGRKHGSIVILSAIIAVGGSAAAKPALAHRAAASPKPYSCQIDPSQPKCKPKTGGTRVTGGSTGKKSGKTGGSRLGGANGRSGGTSGTRGGAGGKGKSGIGGSKSGAGSGAGGSKSGSFVGSGAGANGSSPIPGRGLPVTGYGGTAQDLGASPRASAAGTQAVVVGLASQNPAGSSRVLALPATGGGSPSPSQPASPLLAIVAAVVAVLGIGLRTIVRR